jgi:hypothetical protein
LQELSYRSIAQDPDTQVSSTREARITMDKILIVLFALLATVVPTTAMGVQIDSSADTVEKDAACSNRPSGIFLLSQGADAVALPVQGVFQDLEPQAYSVQSKPAVGIVDFAFARAGGLFQPGGNLDLARNIHEFDNKGYWTHLYLKPAASQRLASAIEEGGASAALVIDGMGKGRVEPINSEMGHWAVANMKYDGPGGYLTVTVNTHIMICWNELGKAPESSDPGRREVEYSIKDYILQYLRQMGGSGIGGAISTDDFSRTGEYGGALYARLLNSGEAEKAIHYNWPEQGAREIAQSMGINSGAKIQSTLLRHVESTEFRRAIVSDYSGSAWRDIEQNLPGAKEDLESFLTDNDPYIASNCFIRAPSESIAKHREKIVNSINACLTEGQLPSKEFARTEMLNRIAEEGLTECAEALSELLRRNDASISLKEGIETLGHLGAFELIKKVILDRPGITKDDLQTALGFSRWRDHEDDDAGVKSIALIELSGAAIDGDWDVNAAQREVLISAMFQAADTFCAVVPSRRSQRPNAQATDKHRLLVRKALRLWIGRDGGEDVLRRLAINSPQAEEIPLFVAGLEEPDLKAVSACIAALVKLEAREAVPALALVLYRDDALLDLHREYRDLPGEERMMIAVAIPPADRDNVAYHADMALFQLLGGKESSIEPAPPHSDRAVLEKRRNYWRQWLQSNPPKESRSL